jgi:hypothetical protein
MWNYKSSDGVLIHKLVGCAVAAAVMLLNCQALKRSLYKTKTRYMKWTKGKKNENNLSDCICITTPMAYGHYNLSLPETRNLSCARQFVMHSAVCRAVTQSSSLPCVFFGAQQSKSLLCTFHGGSGVVAAAVRGKCFPTGDVVVAAAAWW